MYDIVIVGSGCAGMSAAVYACRAGRTALLVEAETIGGQIASSPKVENYPAIREISGVAFSDALFGQAEALGAEFSFARAAWARDDGDHFTVGTSDGEKECRALILATGAKHRKLGVEGEERLTGHGVSYCAVCDGAFFRGRNVAVVGGGNSALQSAEFLSGICESVTLIHRRDTFRGEERAADALKSRPNVKFLLDSAVVSLDGEKALESIKVRNVKTGAETTVAAAGIFISVGQTPDNGAFASLVALDKAGYIIAGEDTLTSHKGVFAAGDCRVKTVRQLTTAAADGAVSALAASAYISAGAGTTGTGTKERALL